MSVAGGRRAWHWPAVAARVVAAILGGYALAALVSTTCALLLPLDRAEAVLTGMLLSFAAYAGAVVWVFAAGSAWLAWRGLLMALAVLGAATWLGSRA